MRTKTYGLALVGLLAAGCGRAPGEAVGLEVQSLSVGGVLEGQDLGDQTFTVAHAERLGDHGAFFLEGRRGTLQVSACPLGDTHVNPYEGEGTSGDPGIGGPAGEIPERGGLTRGCDERTIFLCQDGVCGSLSGEQVELTIHDEGDWRRLTLDGADAASAVSVELVYRERR